MAIEETLPPASILGTSGIASRTASGGKPGAGPPVARTSWTIKRGVGWARTREPVSAAQTTRGSTTRGNRKRMLGRRDIDLLLLAKIQKYVPSLAAKVQSH
jgi:hypothetical protein